MYCQNCGEMIPKEAKFCPNCGAPLVSGQSQQQGSGQSQWQDSEQSQRQGYEQSQWQSSSYDKSSYNYEGDSYYFNQGRSDSQDRGRHDIYNQSRPDPYDLSFGINPRSIVLAVIFSIITCGIYSLYWIYKCNEEINILADEPAATSGGMVILFSIITCGIYGIYWAYKMGERCDKIKGVQGHSNILYLVLAIVGLQIVNLALMQDTINGVVS